MKHKKIKVFDVINISILSLMALITILPMYYVLVGSLTTEGAYLRNPLMLIPENINFDSYLHILSSKNIIRSLMNSSVITIGGTIYSMILSLACAYALTKKHVKGMKVVFGLIIFTMYFGGGLIPFYLLIKNLGLYNNLLSLILPQGINTFYMLILLNAFRGIPDSIEESAKIDGANDIRILFEICIPLIVPSVMCIMLFYIVDKWNEWYSAMLFIKTSNNYPISYVLRTIIVESSLSLSSSSVSSQQINNMRPVYTLGVQRAAMIISIIPILVIYPFLQKYFAKGIMIGAVKG